MEDKLKLYRGLINCFINSSDCPKDIGLEDSCGDYEECTDCRQAAIDSLINVELYEMLKANYLKGNLYECLHDIDDDFYYYESDDCNTNCKDCIRNGIERIEK